MTYHMPRVAHWSQAGSVAHYPTHIQRQLWLGPWAEFAIMHGYLLTGGDRLANLVQWLAFAGCVAGSAIVTGELGGGRLARGLAAVAFATLPMAIAQASSTQNDLVASFWLLSLGYWVLRFRATPELGTALLVGTSAGLGRADQAPGVVPGGPVAPRVRGRRPPARPPARRPLCPGRGPERRGAERRARQPDAVAAERRARGAASVRQAAPTSYRPPGPRT